MQSPDELLREYLRSIESKNIESILGPLLIEIPFLKPNRLVGNAEIESAYREIFTSLESISFDVDRILANETHAIAEGKLRVVRPEQEPEQFQIGITAEAGENGLQRISIYADTRYVRRWADQTIQ